MNSIKIQLLIVLLGVGYTISAQNTIWFKAIECTPPNSQLEPNCKSTQNINEDFVIMGHFVNQIDFGLPSDSIYNVTLGNGKINPFLVMYNKEGGLKWLKTFKSNYHTYDCYVTKMVFDQQGNILIAGYNNLIDFNPDDLDSVMLPKGKKGNSFVAKYSGSNGSLIWAKALECKDSVHILTMDIDIYNNIYLAGTFLDTLDINPNPSIQNNLIPAGSQDGFILKLTSAGNYIWSKQIYGVKNELIHDLKISADQNMYITGAFQFSTNFDIDSPNLTLSNNLSILNYDIFLAKYNLNGNVQWVKQIGNTGNDIGRTLNFDHQTNIYLTGNFNGTVDFDPSSNTSNLTASKSNESYICKYDKNGQFLWNSQIKGHSNINHVKIDNQDNYYISGVLENKILLDNSGNHILTNRDSFRYYGFMAAFNSSHQCVFSQILGDSNYGFSRTDYLGLNNNSIYCIGQAYVLNYPTDTGMAIYDIPYGGYIYIWKLNTWPTAIQNINENKNGLILFPNPANESITLSQEKLKLTNEDTIYILNILGQELKKYTFSETINISDLKYGTYLYHIKTKTGIEYTSKFIKN